MIIFGLDYDNTYTEDVDLWEAFIADAKSRGHLVFIVTARGVDRPVEHKISAEVVYCNAKAKKTACEEQGIPTPSIWIDDMPELIKGNSIIY